MSHLIDLVLHIDQHLTDAAMRYGGWLYSILFAIIFAETGLVVTPFLPGDSLLFAAGAIAASAIPTGAAIGAGAGLAAGSIAGLLSDHGVDEEDSRYFEDRINQGGYFVAVHADQAGPSFNQAWEILQRNGGHSASQPRASQPRMETTTH